MTANNPLDDLEKSVAVVGWPWSESAYYDNAEKWTYLFWDENRVFRRLFDRLDLTSTLELACGHGRHAEIVAKLAGRLTLADIHEGNLEFCKKRLQDYPDIRYLKLDGYTFRPVEDASVTAIYCYDSMVHFSADLVQSYLKDTARVLKPGGMALYHHSNYSGPTDKHYGQNPAARNTMTKEHFAELAQHAELAVEESVAIPWGGVDDLDG